MKVQKISKRIIEDITGNTPDLVFFYYPSVENKLPHIVVCKRSKANEVIKGLDYFNNNYDKIVRDYDVLEVLNRDIAADIIEKHSGANRSDFNLYDNTPLLLLRHTLKNLGYKIGDFVSVSDYVDAMLDTDTDRDNKLIIFLFLYLLGSFVYGSKFERLIKPHENNIRWIDSLT